MTPVSGRCLVRNRPLGPDRAQQKPLFANDGQTCAKPLVRKAGLAGVRLVMVLLILIMIKTQPTQKPTMMVMMMRLFRLGEDPDQGIGTC